MQTLKSKAGRKAKDRTSIPQYNLNVSEELLLRNHLSSERHNWIPLLMALDRFYQSRVDLEFYLVSIRQIPYFTRHVLDAILGNKNTKTIPKAVADWIKNHPDDILNFAIDICGEQKTIDITFKRCRKILAHSKTVPDSDYSMYE